MFILLKLVKIVKFSLRIKMKVFRNYTLLIFGLLIGGKLFGSHIVGSDMTYRSLGENKYLIKVTLFRDCNQIAMTNPSFGCFAGTDGGNGCGGFALTLKPVSVRDVSNRCSTSQVPCSPSNTGFTGSGLEEHVYEAIVDFSKAPLLNFANNSSCCEVTFYVGQCCRSNSLTTGMAGNDFFTTCMINICNLKQCLKSTNSSVDFTNIPLNQLCCNVPVRYNLGAIDTIDFDSLSYKLVDGIASLPKNSVVYATPFTSRYFITPYCIPPTSIKCSPNPNASTPAGNYFDSSSGDVIFTPTKCTESSILVVEVAERRRSINGQWLVIGKTRRDMTLFIRDDCARNKSPLIKVNKGRYFAINLGDSVNIDFDVTDELYVPYQTVSDTVQALWNGGVKGAKFNVRDSKLREKKYQFSWKTDKLTTLPGYYQFTVTATDQNCNPPALTTTSVKIKVNGSAVAGGNDVVMDNQRFVVYPNPTDGKLIIKLNNGNDYCGQAEIYDLSGRLILGFFVTSANTADLSQLAEGQYVIKLRSAIMLINKL